MKKLLLALVLVPLLGLAQEKKVYKEYCFVNLYRDNAEITLGGVDKPVHIKDSLGNKVVFAHKVDVMNYMSKNGWELHSVTIYESGVIDTFIFYRIKEEERE